jgi:hypothetical protein
MRSIGLCDQFFKDFFAISKPASQIVSLVNVIIQLLLLYSLAQSDHIKRPLVDII